MLASEFKYGVGDGPMLPSPLSGQKVQFVIVSDNIEKSVGKVKRGNKMAMDGNQFREIFDTYEKPVYNYVLRMVKDTSVAEELTQDIFIKVYNNLANFRGDSKLSTWIYQIAANTSMDHFRGGAHKRDTKTDSVGEEDEFSAELTSDDRQKTLKIDEALIKSEMGGCIRDFIDNLPEDYRAVIVLHDLQGLKNREIVEVLGCSLEIVKVRLHRARKKLRTVLASNCVFYRNEDNVLSCDRKSENKCGG